MELDSGKALSVSVKRGHDKPAFRGGTPVIRSPLRIGASIGNEEQEAVASVLRRGILSEFRGGEEVRAFEKAFARMHRRKYGIAVSSGTAALHAAMKEVGPGDEVIVPALTFVSTATCVLQEGGIPVMADLDPETLCISPESVRRSLSKRTKAVILVHLYGHAAKVDELLEIARSHDIAIVEDCAQACGTKLKNRFVGAFGHLACFSFFQTKNLTCGEGGMILTDSEMLMRKARLAREHGSPLNKRTWYNYESLGFNYNMSEVQAAIGLAQLRKLKTMIGKRREIATIYSDQLEGRGMILPTEPKDAQYSYSLFTVRLPTSWASRRNSLVSAVRLENAPIDIAYPIPLYRCRLFASYKWKIDPEGCYVSETHSKRLFNLFTSPSLSNANAHKIGEAVARVHGALR